MDFSDWPILLALAIGVIGFGLMTAAFILVARRGGWQKAMQGEDQRRWPLPRRLMAAGALLCAIFPLLTLIPGVVPWWDDSPWHTRLPHFALGAVVAVALIGLTALIQRFRKR